MKKLLVMAAAVMMVAMTPSVSKAATLNDDETTVQKQDKRERMTPEKMVEQRVKMMTKKYNLTDAQQKKFTALYTEMMKNQKSSMRPRREGGRRMMSDTQRDSMRTAMKAHREKMDAEVKKILTEEQYAQYTKEMKERMNQQRPNRPNRKQNKD